MSQEELERLRRETDMLKEERRRVDEKWREEDQRWKKEMMDRTTSIQLSAQQSLARHSGEIKAVGEQTSQLELSVYGNHATNTPGIATRVDRLEQSHKAHVWWSRAAIGAGLSSAAAWLFGK